MFSREKRICYFCTRWHTIGFTWVERGTFRNLSLRALSIGLLVCDPCNLMREEEVIECLVRWSEERAIVLFSLPPACPPSSLARQGNRETAFRRVQWPASKVGQDSLPKGRGGVRTWRQGQPTHVASHRSDLAHADRGQHLGGGRISRYVGEDPARRLWPPSPRLSARSSERDRNKEAYIVGQTTTPPTPTIATY